MATYVYDDFRVTFTPRAEGDFTVRAVDVEGRTTSDVFALPLAADELERAVLEVAHARAARRTRRAAPAPPVTVPAAPTVDVHVTRDVGGDGPPAAATMDAEQLGGALADALFKGDLCAAYDAATTHAASNGRGIRLTLSLAAAPQLLSVPWEFLYRRPRFLASQRRSPLVRLLDTGSLVPPPTIGTTVRMLAVVASPKDLPALDVAGERRRIEQAVAGMAAAGRIELDWLDPASPRALRHALRDGNYHVLHYVGHSAFTTQGEGMLYLEQEPDGTSIAVDSTLFANLLSDQDRLRLVVLNSCEGARTTLSDPYAGVATTLVQLGVPAVVAMQFEISDDAAVVFAEELYTNLIGRQDPVDAAVAEARKAVYTEVDPLEWATPVLFVRDPDVELFRFEVPAAPLPPPEPPGLQEERAKGPRWVRPITKFASWTQGWPRVLRWAAALLTVVAVAATGYGVYRVITNDGEPPPPPVQFPTVDAGSIGAEVTAAQYLLREHDGTNDHVTGVFDEETKEAIRRFEATLPAVPDDGILGPLTWSELVVPIQQSMEGDAVPRDSDLAQQRRGRAGGRRAVRAAHARRHRRLRAEQRVPRRRDRRRRRLEAARRPGGRAGAGGRLARHAPAPRLLDSVADADPAADEGLGRWRGAVVGDEQLPRADEVGAVVRTVDPERLAQLARAVRQDPIGPGTATGAHDLDPAAGRDRAQQHGLAVTGRSGHDVGAEVHPVGEVDVELPPGPNIAALRGVRPRNAWLAGSSGRYASTSTMRPAHSPATNTLFNRSGATSRASRV